MTDRHRRRRPERDDEAEIDRVPHELVVERRAETRRRHLAAGEIVGDLMQPEQLEMVDQERAGEHDQPADERQPGDRQGDLRIVDCQTTAGIGRHCQNSSMSARLENST